MLVGEDWGDGVVGEGFVENLGEGLGAGVKVHEAFECAWTDNAALTKRHEDVVVVEFCFAETGKGCLFLVEGLEIGVGGFG